MKLRDNLYSSVEVFDTLPEDIKQKAISTFGAYSDLNISREYGKWSVNTCSAITRDYAPDHLVYFFNKEEIRKKYADEIKREEDRFYEESKYCNWDSLND